MHPTYYIGRSCLDQQGLRSHSVELGKVKVRARNKMKFNEGKIEAAMPRKSNLKHKYSTGERSWKRPVSWERLPRVKSMRNLVPKTNRTRNKKATGQSKFWGFNFSYFPLSLLEAPFKVNSSLVRPNNVEIGNVMWTSHEMELYWEGDIFISDSCTVTQTED